VTAVSATAGGPVPDVHASTAPVAGSRRHRSGFWAATFAFLVVMAVATLPSPLYGLYRIRDHLSALTITVVFAIFAASTIVVLLRDSAVAARIGRRGTMLASVATMMVAMGVLAVWKDLAGLLKRLGLGTLGESMLGRVDSLNYKTVRYPGHRDAMRMLLEDLRLAERRALLKDVLESSVPITHQDVVLIFVSVAGWREAALARTIARHPALSAVLRLIGDAAPV